MFRAADVSAGSRWIKAISLSFQCSKQMMHRKDGDQFSRLLDDEIELNELKDEHEIETQHFQGKLAELSEYFEFQSIEISLIKFLSG